MGGALMRISSALTMPFLLTVLSPVDYGVISLINTFINILSIFLGLGLRQAIWLNFFHHSVNEKKKIVNEILSTYIFVSLPIMAFLLFNTSSINKLLFSDQVDQAIIVVAIISSFISFFCEFLYQILKFQQQAFLCTLLQLINTLSVILLNCILILKYKIGPLGMIVSICFSSIIICCVGSYLYFKKKLYIFLKLPSKDIIFNYIINGMPFIPTMLFSWIIASSDKLILAKLATLADVGLYAIADTAGQLYYFIILQAVGSSYVPYILQEFANINNHIITEKENKIIMLYSMLVATVIVTIATFIAKKLAWLILPTSYIAVTDYIWLILMGYIFLMGTYFTNAYIQYKGKTFFIAFSFCIPAIINLVLNVLLIPKFKIYGCIIASLTAYIVYFCVSFGYNSYLIKKYKMRGQANYNFSPSQ